MKTSIYNHLVRGFPIAMFDCPDDVVVVLSSQLCRIWAAGPSFKAGGRRPGRPSFLAPEDGPAMLWQWQFSRLRDFFTLHEAERNPQKAASSSKKNDNLWKQHGAA
jgi:hypothetical protein